MASMAPIELGVERLPCSPWQVPAFLLTTPLGFTVEVRAGCVSLLTPCCGDYVAGLEYEPDGTSACAGCDAVLPWPATMAALIGLDELDSSVLEAWALIETDPLALALEAASVRDAIFAFMAGTFAEAEARVAEASQVMLRSPGEERQARSHGSGAAVRL